MLALDPLTEVLQTMHLESVLLCRSILSPPWGVRLRAEYGAKFHIVTSGQGWLRVEDLDTPVHLSSGDLVVLPHRVSHTLCDALTSPVTDLEEILSLEPVSGFKLLKYGGNQESGTTVIISGGINFHHTPTNPLLAALPSLIHVKGEQGQSLPWLTTTLQSFDCETATDLPGGQTVLTRLADILFIQAIRSYIAQLPNHQGGWLRALRTPGISNALSVMHRYPEQDWTVSSLAQRASMSRSSFAARFTQLVGVPPLRYLMNWRMNKAVELLQDKQLTMKEIAVQVGYSSEVVFSQVFKRWSGYPPGLYRHKHLEF
ncbi:AraC family transcriptional regulator [Nostoc sp.]|uniref:AraC family transcriptional regulator n=1 Tax=Nostoc sp. TaxID=1180 RepID=UPI002FF765B2